MRRGVASASQDNISMWLTTSIPPTRLIAAVIAVFTLPGAATAQDDFEETVPLRRTSLGGGVAGLGYWDTGLDRKGLGFGVRFFAEQRFSPWPVRPRAEIARYWLGALAACPTEPRQPCPDVPDELTTVHLQGRFVSERDGAGMFVIVGGGWVRSVSNGSVTGKPAAEVGAGVALRGNDIELALDIRLAFIADTPSSALYVPFGLSIAF